METRRCERDRESTGAEPEVEDVTARTEPFQRDDHARWIVARLVQSVVCSGPRLAVGSRIMRAHRASVHGGPPRVKPARHGVDRSL